MSKFDGKSLALIQFFTSSSGREGRKILDEAGLNSKLDLIKDALDEKLNNLEANQIDEKKRTPRK